MKIPIGDKLLIEAELRRVLAEIQPGGTLSTRAVTTLVHSHLDQLDMAAVARHITTLGKSPYSLAERGEPEPAPQPFKNRTRNPDATIRRLKWRRIASPDMPATKAEPSKLTLGEAMASLAPSYAGRREPGTFGAASDVRSLTERLADVERRVCDLEEAALCKGVRL